MLPMPAGMSWQEHYKSEFKELLNYESAVFIVDRILQAQVINSLCEHTFLVTSKNIFSPPFQVYRARMNHSGWGLHRRCLEKKRETAQPRSLSALPTRLPCKWERDVRASHGNSLLHSAIIEGLLGARAFHIECKRRGQDLACGSAQCLLTGQHGSALLWALHCSAGLLL